MSFTIVTDAGSALDPRVLEQEDFLVIPMSVIIDNEEYPYSMFDDTRSHEFFELLRSGKISKTSQPNKMQVTEVLNKTFNLGKDIIYIGFSDKLSGTFDLTEETFKELSQEHPSIRYTVINTKAASGGMGILGYKALKFRNEGLSFDEASDKLKELVHHTCHWFTVENMETLRRGGRIGFIKSKAVDALNIKPILTVEADGTLNARKTVRGRKRSIVALSDKFTEYADLDLTGDKVIICHGDCADEAQKLKDFICDSTDMKAENIELISIGPIIGSHTGPGSVALFFFGNKI